MLLLVSSREPMQSIERGIVSQTKGILQDRCPHLMHTERTSSTSDCVWYGIAKSPHLSAYVDYDVLGKSLQLHRGRFLITLHRRRISLQRRHGPREPLPRWLMEMYTCGTSIFCCEAQEVSDSISVPESLRRKEPLLLGRSNLVETRGWFPFSSPQFQLVQGF